MINIYKGLLLSVFNVLNVRFVLSVLLRKVGYVVGCRVVFLLICVASILESQSQTLGVYEFSGLNGCVETLVSSPSNNVEFSLFNSEGTSCGFLPSVYDRYSWNTSSLIKVDEYDEFTVSPEEGWGLSLIGLSFNHKASLFGSGEWILRSSLDGFTADLATGVISSSSETVQIDLPISFKNVEEVTFRFYVKSMNSFLTHWSLDDVRIEGEVKPKCNKPERPGMLISNSPQCLGDGVEISCSEAAPAGVTWYWQGAEPNGENTMQSATSLYNASLTGTYYLRALNNVEGCWSDESSSINVEVQSPSILLEDESIVCAGTPAVKLIYSATTNNPDKYSIDYDSMAEAVGFVDVVDADLPLGGIDLSIPPTAKGVYNYILKVKNSSLNCSGSEIEKSVTVNSRPIVNASGPDQVVQSESPSAILLSGANVVGETSEGAWSIVSGGGVLSNTSLTANPEAISYTPEANYSGTVILRLTSDSIVCSSASDDRFITVSPASIQTYITAGTHSYTIPACVTTVVAEAWGAGGGGGGNDALEDGGGGGGGGAYSKSIINVIPGSVYTLNVGLGGKGGEVGEDGIDGSGSWFVDNGTLLAKGGSGGLKQNGGLFGRGGAGGQGGQASSGVGTEKYSGGNGATGLDNLLGVGGGGGASAGNVEKGGSAPEATAGVSIGGVAPTAGGGGGNGAYLKVGENGIFPGGAGAGGSVLLSGIGGNGADGKVSVSWSSDLLLSDNPVDSGTICQGVNNEPIHSFKLQGENACVSGFKFITSGDYLGAEIESFKLYYTTDSLFSTTNLLSTIITPQVAGPQEFPSFNQTIVSGVDYYFWVTVDVSQTINNDHNIEVASTSATDITSSTIARGAAEGSGILHLKIPKEISVNSPVICEGDLATIIAEGASSYLWSTGERSSEINVSPEETTTYTVSTVSIQGCTALTEVTVQVVNELTLSANVSDDEGTIELNPLCGTQPYSYYWFDGDTSRVKSDLELGSYKVVVTDSVGASLVKIYRLYTPVEWIDTVGLIIDGDLFTKTETQGYSNAGAKSKNLAYANSEASIRYIVNGLDNRFTIGLSAENKQNQEIESTIAAIEINQTGLSIYRRGQKDSTIYGLREGDILELVQGTDSLQVLKNGKIVYTALAENPSALKVDYLPYQEGQMNASIEASFGLPQLYVDTRIMDSMEVTFFQELLTESGVTGEIKRLDVSPKFIDTLPQYFFVEFTGDQIRETLIKCKTNRYATIESVEIYNSEAKEYNFLDTKLFTIVNNHELLFIPIGKSSTQLKERPQVYLTLEGGLLLSPNGDGKYDNLELHGNELLGDAEFELFIYDLSGIEVFRSKDKGFSWNGQGVNSNIIEGTYNYRMTINGDELSGDFLISL